MNPDFSGQAKLHYDTPDFTIMETGAYVLCAVTQTQIPLDQLKYWNADLQEAYKDGQTAAARWKAVNG
ncbi:MAG: DUF2093 domain-containing protein [Robiginitomaculum sp.]